MSRLRNIPFENFSGYLNYLGYYDGYGGMQWNDMFEVQSAYITQNNWCETGYNNDLRGNGEATTLGSGGFQAFNLAHSFDLVQGNFASAWEHGQPITAYSYTYAPGQGFTLKASDTFTVGQHSKTIYFANYGTDFTRISAVTFVSGQGSGGNTCSYGYATYGYALVMDNLQINWHRTTAMSGDRPIARSHPNLHLALPHLNAMFAPAHTQGHEGSLHQPMGEHAAGHDPGGGNFMLPHADHSFGVW